MREEQMGWAMTKSQAQGPKGVVLLGSTGSIGESSISVFRNLGPDKVRVIGLAAGRRIEKLAEQALEFRPKFVSCLEGEPHARLRELLKDTDIQVLRGAAGQCTMVRAAETDSVIAAVSGAAGLPAVIETVKHGGRLCLSNKESLVVAGPMVRRLARENNAELLPVDSEHSALFQCLQAGHVREVKRLMITASGGPFRTRPKADMHNASIQEALKHPTWTMGPRITIDSATLMNKALELIEAHFLFDLPGDKIEVIVHPQSIIHSLVEFVDGSVMSQLGVPDMRVPIQYALTYPERTNLPTAKFDLTQIARLDFEAVDHQKFPALKLAYQVIRHGGSAGAVLNAANEESRESFLEGKIQFGQILEINAQVLARYFQHPMAKESVSGELTLETLLAADQWAREEAASCLQSLI